MTTLTGTQEALLALAQRLRSARIDRGDTQQVFAQRLGVSESTLREMEKGSPTVQVGSWVAALWVFDRLEELDGLLADKVSILDRARAEAAGRKRRQRAPRRPRTS